MKTPWAILLCRFKDKTAEPYSRSRYEEIFTSAGAGKWSLPDFFRDMSHGMLDLSGSRVFGWYTLDKDAADYKGSGQNPDGRDELLMWARDAAARDLEKFPGHFNVVVVLNGFYDLFGGPNGAVCGDDGSNTLISRLSLSAVGQEVGHVYGLSHSRREGSTTDYRDPFDIMSTFGIARMAAHPVYKERNVRDGSPVFRIGPGLNAANMHGRGWLDSARTWTAPARTSISTTIELRPLHRRDLQGWLAARIDDFFIEFRGGEGWDAGFPPAVMVHQFEGNRSYLVSSDSGQEAMGPGSKIESPPSLSLYGSAFRIEVVSIDAGAKKARVKVHRIPAQVPEYEPIWGPFQTPWIKWSEAQNIGDALVVLDGRPRRIERGTPLHAILQAHALHDDGLAASSPELGLAMRQAALVDLNLATESMLATLSSRAPAPEAPSDALAAETSPEDVEIPRTG
jgi:hypothetical protein